MVREFYWGFPIWEYTNGGFPPTHFQSAEIRVDFHENRPLLSLFIIVVGQNWNVSRVLAKPQNQISRKSVQHVASFFMCIDRQTNERTGGCSDLKVGSLECARIYKGESLHSFSHIDRPTQGTMIKYMDVYSSHYPKLKANIGINKYIVHWDSIFVWASYSLRSVCSFVQQRRPGGRFAYPMLSEEPQCVGDITLNPYPRLNSPTQSRLGDETSRTLANCTNFHLKIIHILSLIFTSLICTVTAVITFYRFLWLCKTLILTQQFPI
jgi:hypothetical protein